MGDVGDDRGVDDFHGVGWGIHIELNDIDLRVLAEKLPLDAALSNGQDGWVGACFAFGALGGGEAEQERCSGEREQSG